MVVGVLLLPQVLKAVSAIIPSVSFLGKLW